MKTLIGIKQNMSQIFMENGNIVPVTYIAITDVVVAHKKTVEKDGYSCLVLGFGKKHKPTKAELGKFQELGYVPEFQTEVEIDDNAMNIGDKVTPALFADVKKCSVTGVTKGKGFQGVMKRWGFHGTARTHGQSDRQRHPGSIGMRTTPGRVFKGKKMGGHMGTDTMTVKNLKVVTVDDSQGLIAVKGAVPGNTGALVIIKSVK